MGRRRKSLAVEERERLKQKGKMKEQAITVEDDDGGDEEESDDENGLDDFEDDFIVDFDEEEDDNPQETQEANKKKRKSSKCIVLDDDDLELIRENQVLGINQEKSGDGKFKKLKKDGVDGETSGHSTEFLRSLFDDNVEDELHLSDDAEDKLADFIVDDEEVSYGEKDTFRQRKFSESKHSSSQLNDAKYNFGLAIPLPGHCKEDPFTATEFDEGYRFESPALAEVNLVGKRNPLDDKDIPERMQIFEDMVGSIPVDIRSIEEESSWILSQLSSNPLFIEKREDGESCRLHTRIKREDIVRFLELNHAKKYDIPFIAMYRKGKCLTLLEDPELDEAGSTENDTERKSQLKWHKVLWIIRELDKKWLLLQKRKSILMTSYNDRFHEECQTTFSDEKSSFNQKLSEAIINMLKSAESDREIDDIELKFNLHFPPVEGFLDASYKRPVKESYYSKCSMAGLWSLASKFGNTEKFGLLITPEKVGMENHEDPEESPEELALVYKCAAFETSASVLEGARHMAAVEISSEMSVRKYVRNIYMDRALLSTSPTSKGNMTMDTHHQSASVKWLQDKPLSKFKDAQWLIIQNAEKEELLEVKIRLPDDVLSDLTNACNDVYLNRSEQTSSQLWNEQRKSIVQDAISNFLLPSMEKEARKLLTSKAKNWLIVEYGKELWNRVSVAPYQYMGNVTAKGKGTASKVMACCWGTGKPGTTFVMLDSKGELVDVIHAGSLTLRSQNINDQQRKKNDQLRLLKFLTNHRPQVTVIGANASCVRLRDDINEIISMLGENHEDVSPEMKGLTTVLGDESLPQLYENSEISEDQLPRQHGIVKRAVALGRYFLNPLAMVATLCGVKREILSWKLNPLEQFLTNDEKLGIIEWVMADVTNQVGVDVNLVVSHNWLSAPLQFVSGLGPRTADILRRELLGGTTPGNRKYLSKCGLNSMRIFWNAVGFLKVSCDEPIFADTVANILDRTRVHPESYHLAEEFARAVYRHYNPDSDVTQMNAIEILQDEPKLLQDFDVNDYAAKLEVETGESVRETLYDIKEELLDGFKDPRMPYEEPTQDEEFLMMTRETGDVLFEGKRVQATVRNVQSKQAFCILDSGLAAVLLREDFSDEADDIFLTDKLCEGAVLNCKIKFIDKNRCRVNLTCKASELKSDGEQSFHDIDPYYCEGKILPSQLGDGKKEELENKHFKPRMISHPHFQNITAGQAKEFLADKAVGRYIFHPSCSCLWKLTLTLKIFDGLCVHKDIVEGGKTLDMKSMLALGKTLKIGEEIFEDIDKVVERFVNPLVVNLKVILNHQKFKGSKAEVDKLLKLEKEEYPKRIVYDFAISFEHPGTFILSYIRSTHLHHEFIGIQPKGFKFRKQLFENIEQLVAYFQNHINDNILPPKKPIIGGSWGKSMDGDRRFMYSRMSSPQTTMEGMAEAVVVAGAVVVDAGVGVDVKTHGVRAKAMMEDMSLTRTIVHGAVLKMTRLAAVMVGLILILLCGQVMLTRVGVAKVQQVKAMFMNPLMILKAAGEGELGVKVMNVTTKAVVVDGVMLGLKLKATIMMAVGLILSLLVGKVIQARVGVKELLVKTMTEEPLGSRVITRVRWMLVVTMIVIGDKDEEGTEEGEEEEEAEGTKVVSVDGDVKVIMTTIVAADGATLEMITVAAAVAAGIMMIFQEGEGEGEVEGAKVIVKGVDMKVVIMAATMLLDGVQIGEVIKERVGVRVFLLMAMAGELLRLVIRIAKNAMRTAPAVVFGVVGEVTKERVWVMMVLNVITMVVVGNGVKDREEGENGVKLVAGELLVMMTTKALKDNRSMLELITLGVVAAGPVVGVTLVVVVILLVMEVLVGIIGATRKETQTGAIGIAENAMRTALVVVVVGEVTKERVGVMMVWEKVTAMVTMKVYPLVVVGGTRPRTGKRERTE